MRQYKETYTILEMREIRSKEWTTWHKPLNGKYRPAELLAYQGRLTEAIERAQEIQIADYGNMHGIEFRCVTKSTTVTANTPLHDGWHKT
jgi:hypothetical protein